MATPELRRGLYTGLLIAYGVYVYALFACANADAGPPRWLDDLELALIGRYWTIASVMILAVPPFALLQVAQRTLAKKDELDIASGWLSGRRDRADWLWAAAFGLLALVVGGLLLFRGGTAGEIRVLRAADAEAAGAAEMEPGSWVEVHGFAARKAIEVSRIGAATYYVPLLAVKPASKKEEAATPPAPPTIVVESDHEDSDFAVDPGSGEVTARGLVVSAPAAARVAGGQVGLVEDRPVLYVRAGASPTRDLVAGALVLLAGALAVALQLRRKKLASSFDQEIARNEGAW
jgi:hypothetical protein